MRATTSCSTEPCSMPLTIPARGACRSSHSASRQRHDGGINAGIASPARAVTRNSDITSSDLNTDGASLCIKTSSGALASTAGGPSKRACPDDDG